MDKRAIIRERAQLLRELPGQQVPEPTLQVLEQADQIAGGVVFFYYTRPVQVGLKDIDWSGGHIKHQEWSAQLNRFFHLQTLASAYRKTGDEKYARAARAYIEDWLRGDVYRDGASLRPGDNTLNMSIRLGTSEHGGWGGVLPVFLESPAFDDAFLGRVLDSIRRQAHWLSQHLTAAGNWRISQLDALVCTALRFPFLDGADELLRVGTSGMAAGLATQFLPDGVHIERTPGYHTWMTSVAASYAALAGIFPEANAGVDRPRLIGSLDYICQADLFGVNDATAPHRDPAAFKGLEQRRRTLEKLGLLEQAGPLPPLQQVFNQAGQVFARTAWKPGADYLAFDASTWGGAHSHLSRLGLAFRSGGRMLVADPGILNYEMSDPLAAYGKSTRAHSTLNIEGLNQSGADGALLRAEFTDEVALLHGKYEGGYWEGTYTWGFNNGRGRGVYGSHDRIVFWVKGEYLLVLDSMSTDKGRQIQNVWQMGPMDGWSHDADSRLWWSKNRDANLLVRMIAPEGGVTMEVREGSREPLAGWVGWHGNDAAAAPQVVFGYPANRGEYNVSAVLLAAFAGEKRPAYEMRASRISSGDSLHHLELGLPDGSVDRIAWSRQLALPIDDGRPIETDAPFAWYRTDAAGKMVKGFVLDGSYLRSEGRAIFSAESRKSRMLGSQ